jgi:hypothetical protein
MSTRRPNAHAQVAAVAFAVTLFMAASARPAGAQAVIEPAVPDLVNRSGLVSRMVPIEPHLPPDPRRDQWYDTRWADPPNVRYPVRWYPNGGLYGLAWKADHTKSISPYFFGAPGRSTLHGDENKPGYIARFTRSAFHPFNPVGMYYDQGSYVPVPDFRPFVPGPGAWPYPIFRRLTNWGG